MNYWNCCRGLLKHTSQLHLRRQNVLYSTWKMNEIINDIVMLTVALLQTAVFHNDTVAYVKKQ